MDEWLSEIIEKCAASPCMWVSSADGREQLEKVLALQQDERRDVIASMIDRIDEQVIEIDELRTRLAEAEVVLSAKLHKRRCHDCGHIGWYADNITPYCLCEKCRSQDTRLIRAAESAQQKKGGA